MEEELLKILRFERSYVTTNAILIDPEQVAFEIADHYRKFIEWIGENCNKNEDDPLWIYDESPMTLKYFNTLNELYNYYHDNVSKK